MQRVILTAAAVIFAAIAPLPAQSIAGTWQGTLPIAASGQGTAYRTLNLRVAFTIDKSPDGSFRRQVARSRSNHECRLPHSSTVSLLMRGIPRTSSRRQAEMRDGFGAD